MDVVDELLNKLTIYRVSLYSLILLSIYTIILSATGVLFFGPLNLIATLLVLVEICFVANVLLAKIFKIKTNQESFAITALILFFILEPMQSLKDAPFYVLAGTLAIGSKFVITRYKKHIFNPAGFAIVILGFMGAYQVSWWVGNSYIFPAVLILGLLIVRKLKRASLFTSYLIFSLISISLYAIKNGENFYALIGHAIISWPLIFLGAIMLTEPQTTPPHKSQQIQYGALVGILSGVQLSFGNFFNFTPELALLIGNFYSFLISKRKRLELALSSRRKLSDGIFEFSFPKKNSFAFIPGQYMEWTLPHQKVDSRGVRRYFTLSSSPTESDIKLGVKVNKNSSSFKNNLINLKIDEKVYADNLSGDFHLPRNKKRKLVFIAGGIGITPFRSMIKYLSDKNESRDIILFYFASSPEDFVYKDIFERAKRIGLKPKYILTREMPNIEWNGMKGHLTEEMLKKEVPDFMNRKFFLSGPSHMIDSYKKILSSVGVGPGRIITDYFPGY